MSLTPTEYAAMLNGKLKPRKKKKSWRDSGEIREINWDANSHTIKDGSREPYTLGQKYRRAR